MSDNAYSPPPPRALIDRIVQHAIDRPDAPAYVHRAVGTLTYRQLVDRAAAITAWVAANVPPGGVIILSSPGNLDYPAAFLGILTAGCTVFPLSLEIPDQAVIRAAADSSATAVIGDDRAVRLLGEGGLGLVARLIHDPAFYSSSPDAIAFTHAPVIGDLLLQSSGTTGLPKIARRSGESLSAVARATANAVRFTPQDRVLMTVPLTHSYGLEHGLFAPLWAGSCVHLCPGLDLRIMLPELAAGITLFPGVPSTFELLANLHGNAPAMPALRAAYAAGAPLPASVFDAFFMRFGVPVTQLYGATEIGSVTYNPPADPFDAASVGYAMEGASIRILDLHGDGSPLAPGTEGQIAIRAPSMFSGYLHEDAPLADGHFITGDLGKIDLAGRLFVTGRIKLLIDVGGMKVNPLEVEAVLQRHAKVAACAVVAIAQTETVNRLKAFIEPRNPADPPSIPELRQLARDHLSVYKVPRFFEFRSPLPRSAVGKILRHHLETP